MHTDKALGIVRSCGFELAGVARAEGVGDYSRYREWVEKGFAGEMRYLTDQRGPVREDVRNLLPSARSVICVGKLYHTSYEPREGVRIARYAAGRDYHDVVRDGLERAARELLAIESFEYKICVDTAPVLERSLAREAGLGWIGRNTCLINEPQGSWFFLGELITSLELEAGVPGADRCGTCMRCIEACPTQALVEDGQSGWTLDSRRCIAYLTIELRGPIPEEMRAGVGDHLFGCDVCQEVCPWNARAPVTGEDAFEGRAREMGELEGMSREEFEREFGGTAVERARWEGWRRNLGVIRNNLATYEHE